MHAGYPAVPMPPTNLSAPYNLSLTFTAICGLFFAAAVIYALSRGIREGEWLGLVCVLGGLLMGFLEAPLDYLGLCWFASDNAYIAIRTFHRFIPLYVVLGYSFFFAAQAYVAYRGALAGKSAPWFWGLFAFAWLFDGALQITGAQFGLYEFYGPAAYRFLGARIWWYTIDAALPACAALMFLCLRSQMSKPGGIFLAIPLLPAVYGGLNMAAGWPVFTTLNSTSSEAINWIGGSVTILLALWIQMLAVNRIQDLIKAQGLQNPILPHP